MDSVETGQPCLIHSLEDWLHPCWSTALNPATLQMRTNPVTRIAVLAACLCPLFLGMANATTPTTQTETGAIWGYVFKGFNPQKTYRKVPSPVIGADAKGLRLETKSGEKRSKYGQDGVSLSSVVQLTPHFAEIRDFELELSNLAQQRRADALAAALDSEAADIQSMIDAVDATPEGSQPPGQPDDMTREGYRESLQADMAERESLRDPFGSDSRQIADSIYISFTVLSGIDLSTAYAAVVVYHDALDSAGQPNGRSAVLSLEKIGDLKGGVPRKVSFSLRTREQLIQNTEFRCYLFTGDGQPVATNASGETQSITVAQKVAIEQKLDM